MASEVIFEKDYNFNWNIDSNWHLFRIQFNYYSNFTICRHWGKIDDALRSAVVRGVKVRMLTAALHYPDLLTSFLRSLQALDGATPNSSIEVVNKSKILIVFWPPGTKSYRQVRGLLDLWLTYYVFRGDHQNVLDIFRREDTLCHYLTLIRFFVFILRISGKEWGKLIVVITKGCARQNRSCESIEKGAECSRVYLSQELFPQSYGLLCKTIFSNLFLTFEPFF